MGYHLLRIFNKVNWLTYTLIEIIISSMERSKDHLYSISELSESFSISTRTIRFYESKQLLKPRRIGGNRVYNYSEKARLALILRAKRLGFSLTDIREYIDLYDADPDQKEQIKLLLNKVDKRIKHLKQQQQDLVSAIQELEDIERQCADRLNQIDADY